MNRETMPGKELTEWLEERRWPDEGFRHPPLKNVRKVRVHLNHIGPLPPRFSYDPDHE